MTATSNASGGGSGGGDDLRAGRDCGIGAVILLSRSWRRPLEEWSVRGERFAWRAVGMEKMGGVRDEASWDDGVESKGVWEGGKPDFPLRDGAAA